MIDPKKYELRLVQRKEELDRRLHRIETDLERPADPDTEEQATERENDQVLERLGTAAVDEVRAIEAALVRIRQGRYGICSSCGSWLSEERLDALPYAPLCSNCAVNPKRRKRRTRLI